MEVGKKMGVVEDVERRRRLNDQNLFLWVKVVLLISKPLRRGEFLMGSDGKRHWFNYKYERMQIFCYYCGILGHDLRPYPAYFTSSKKDTTIDYQYRDWLRAASGQNKSPPRRSKDSLPKAALMAQHNDKAEKNSGVQAAALEVARASKSNDSPISQDGRNDLDGNVPKI